MRLQRRKRATREEKWQDREKSGKNIKRPLKNPAAAV